MKKYYLIYYLNNKLYRFIVRNADFPVCNKKKSELKNNPNYKTGVLKIVNSEYI